MPVPPGRLMSACISCAERASRIEELEKEKRALTKSIDAEASAKKKEAEEGEGWTRAGMIGRALDGVSRDVHPGHGMLSCHDGPRRSAGSRSRVVSPSVCGASAHPLHRTAAPRKCHGWDRTMSSCCCRRAVEPEVCVWA